MPKRKQAAVTGSSVEFVPTNTSLPRSDNGPVEFNIAGVEDQCIDTREIFLHIVARVMQLDEKKQPKEIDNLMVLAPTAYWLMTMWSSIEVHT